MYEWVWLEWVWLEWACLEWVWFRVMAEGTIWDTFQVPKIQTRARYMDHLSEPALNSRSYVHLRVEPYAQTSLTWLKGRTRLH